jgi:ABC-type nitrate/sulfonate/bicarbonate transport system permease component
VTRTGLRRALPIAVEVLVPLAVLVAVILWTQSAQSFYFPPAGDIATAFKDTWFSSGFVDDAIPSLYRLFAGYWLAVFVGIGGGVLLTELPRLRAALRPIIEFLRVLPSPALIPVFLLAFGLGDVSKIGLVVMGCTWPILLNTINGIAGVDDTYVATARAYRISPWRRIRRVMLPAASPQIAAGMRTSVSIGLIMMVVSEMVGSTNGIGYFVQAAQGNFDMPGMWSGIVLIGIVGYVLNSVFRYFENRILVWHREVRE